MSLRTVDLILSWRFLEVHRCKIMNNDISRCFLFYWKKHTRVSHRGAPPPPSPPPPSYNFFSTPSPSSIKTDVTLKNEAPHWKEKPSSRKWFLEKNPGKSETVNNNCLSVLKQHRKKMAEILQEYDFLTCSIQNFVRKVKQKINYVINWLA